MSSHTCLGFFSHFFPSTLDRLLNHCNYKHVERIFLHECRESFGNIEEII